VIVAPGLDRPTLEQYLRWFGGILLHGNLGKSLWQSTPVTEQFAASLPVTFELGLIARVVVLFIGFAISPARQSPRPVDS